jgi:UDP-hydrolysing UDP-N-acetyl-D-glucosamine 2-epimerase
MTGGGRRVVGVLTTGRQDWGILRSTCEAIRDHPELQLVLIAGGTHASTRHGHTLKDLHEDGFAPDAILPFPEAPDGDPSAASQASSILGALGETLERTPLDALVLAGDRYETAAAAIAATVAHVPLVHLHGGEETAGAFDDPLRHAITKLSHLHLVSRDEHRRRVIALGEDPSAVHVVGAPGLDAAVRDDLPDRASLEASLGLALEPPVVLVTVHPATLEPDPAAAARAVVAAMDEVAATYVITLPNADPGSDEVRTLLSAAAQGRRRTAVDALGSRRYWGLLRIADALLGNSSSGLIEAPAVDLPAVDVGDRQLGRARDANVFHASASAADVAGALRHALDPATRAAIAHRHDPLADGRVGRRITDIIAAWRPPEPLRKPPVPVPD